MTQPLTNWHNHKQIDTTINKLTQTITNFPNLFSISGLELATSTPGRDNFAPKKRSRSQRDETRASRRRPSFKNLPSFGSATPRRSMGIWRWSCLRNRSGLTSAFARKVSGLLTTSACSTWCSRTRETSSQDFSSKQCFFRSDFYVSLNLTFIQKKCYIFIEIPITVDAA